MNVSDEFSVLLTESQPRIYGFILKRTADHDAAKEILQESNLVMCRKADQFKPGTNFMAWAFQIAHFQILSFKQKQYKKPILSNKVIELLSEEKEDNHTPLKIDALNNCLANLPDDKRELIQRRYSKGFSVKEYACQTGQKENAISKMLHKIRNILGDCIKRKLAEV